MGDAAVEDEDDQQLGAEGCGDRRDDDQQAGGTDPAESEPDGSLFVLACRRSCLQSRQRGVASTYVVFDMPTTCASS